VLIPICELCVHLQFNRIEIKKVIPQGL